MIILYFPDHFLLNVNFVLFWSLLYFYNFFMIISHLLWSCLASLTVASLYFVILLCVGTGIFCILYTVQHTVLSVYSIFKKYFTSSSSFYSRNSWIKTEITTGFIMDWNGLECVYTVHETWLWGTPPPWVYNASAPRLRKSVTSTMNITL